MTIGANIAVGIGVLGSTVVLAAAIVLFLRRVKASRETGPVPRWMLVVAFVLGVAMVGSVAASIVGLTLSDAAPHRQ